MQFTEKQICFVSKNRQIRYIFAIFSQTFYLFILFVFYIFIHKKSHLPKKTFSCFYLTDDFFCGVRILLIAFHNCFSPQSVISQNLESLLLFVETEYLFSLSQADIHNPHSDQFYMLLLFSIIEIIAIVFICDIISIDPCRIKKNFFLDLYFLRRCS